MSVKLIVLCLAFALSLSVGQVLFKFAAVRAATLEGSFIERAALNYALWIALGWYALTALFWYYILLQAPLGVAYLFALTGALFVPIWARLLFNEPLSLNLIWGYILVTLGLYVGIAGR
jgi:hypothetical protein